MSAACATYAHWPHSTAELAERIALDLKRELLSIAPEPLEAQLLDLMQEVAQQHIRCVTRLRDLLSAVAKEGALPVKKAPFLRMTRLCWAARMELCSNDRPLR